MTIDVTPTALVDPTAIQSLLTPTLLALTGVAAVVTLLLYTERPQVSRRAVVSLVPWMVVAAALSVLASRADYPALVRPAVNGPGAYLTTYTIVCLVWFLVLQFARGGSEADRLPVYLGSMGAGAATVVVGAVLLLAGSLDVIQVFWLAIAPVAAIAVAGVILLLLGIWYPEAAAYTGMTGGLVVFGHALAAIGTAVAVMADGGHTALSWTVLNLVMTVGAASRLGVDLQLLWTWSFIWLKLVLAIVAIVVLTAYTRQQPNRGNLLLGLVAALGVVGGVTTLLSMVVA